MLHSGGYVVMAILCCYVVVATWKRLWSNCYIVVAIYGTLEAIEKLLHSNGYVVMATLNCYIVVAP